jgi:thiol:disulfide interchange protein DsbC
LTNKGAHSSACELVPDPNYSRGNVMRITIAIFCCLLLSESAFGFGQGVEGCSGDCTACHKVTKREVEDIFKTIDPAASVQDVSPAQARGLYQVTLKKGGVVQVMYLDFSKSYLVAGPLIDVKNKRDLTRQSVEAATTLDVTGLPLQSALVMGNAKGRELLYVFSDPECPYCANLHKTLAELAKEKPELKIYIFLIPLDIYPNSLWKTDSIMCRAREDRSSALKMLENSYQRKEVARQNCGVNYGMQNKNLGTKLGIAVTPTIAFQNGKVFMGARSKDDIKAMLDGGPRAK